jgi:phosphopantothenoylcysteine decarboxylase / phosphopantothenate---cysteine ligase
VSDLAGTLAGRHVLLGVSGGIAAYKAASLARALRKSGATVQAVLTDGAARFVGPATFEGLTGRPVYADVFDHTHRIIHVELAREADVAVLAPATANVIAKLAMGMADDLLTSTFTCLTCPVVIAPAMHTEMWEHPATVDNVALLARRGARIVGPDAGALAGGDEGPGRLAEESDLLAAIAGALRDPEGPLAGRRVVVTAGGTREPIDPVRYIGNRSSGKMGYAIAAAAAGRGAHVDLVSAPTHLPVPPGVVLHPVETALQMRDAVLPLAEKADVVVKAAAVADFRPATYHELNIKKDEAGLAQVALERNPDILAELGEQRPSSGGPVLVGFAAETDLEEERGREKLERKGLDLIVINRVDAADAGFNVDTNRALVLGADGLRLEVPLTSKARLAEVLCDRVEFLLSRPVS